MDKSDCTNGALLSPRTNKTMNNTTLSEPEYFNGPEYKPNRDYTRLKNQIGRVFKIMKDQKWRTLNEISTATSSHTAHGHPDPVASVSAQLRHLRKKRFGNHTVNRKHVSNGLFKYQLIPNG